MEQASSGIEYESIESSKSLPWVHRHRILLVLILSFVSVLLYAGATLLTEPGFPLDDSWIHQTYARNLVETGNWQYAPGITSNGSTSPLWTLLLSAGYLVRLPYLLWAFFLGWICLAWSAVSSMGLWESLWPERTASVWVGFAVIFTWPFVWAAASGMETLIFTALALQILRSYSKLDSASKWQPGLVGLLCGLLISTRPDGLVLMMLIALGMTIKFLTKRLRIMDLAAFMLGSILILIPYFLFNRTLSGEWWPNTLYAKQAEYAFLWDQPLLIRMGQLLLFSLGGPEAGIRGISGAQLLLLPGVLAAAYRSIKEDITSRQLLYTLALLWAVSHVFIFAWRLPVTYQHGRYLWPVIPIWIIYGFAGWGELLRKSEMRLRGKESLQFVLSTGAKAAFGIMLLIFLVLGMQAYGTDVAFVNGEMVNIAKWLRAETPDDALVAAHDIGAIGYFSEKSLIDLAGLISPDVIPLLHDETLVEEFVLQSDADYLVTAPGWSYPGITEGENGEFVYSTSYAWTLSQGFNNMAAYYLAGNR